MLAATASVLLLSTSSYAQSTCNGHAELVSRPLSLQLPEGWLARLVHTRRRQEGGAKWPAGHSHRE